MHHKETTETDLFKPFFAMQQKAIEKERMKEKKSHIFESSTDNDYLSIIEARRHRYIEDKLLLRDLS